MKQCTMRHTFTILALGWLTFLLAACSSGGIQQTHTTPLVPSLTPSPTLTPTPTQSVPSGTLLYQADWSQGLANWGGSTGWQLVNGMPQSDLSQNNALTTPYMPVVANYAVEYRFQIVSVPQGGGFFILKANKTQDKDGYVAGILGLLSPAPHSEFANPQIQVYLDPKDAMDSPMSAAPSDYEPGNGWHTFRVEVQGPLINFLADGIGKGSTASTQTRQLSNGPLQLISSQAIVRIASVQITAL